MSKISKKVMIVLALSLIFVMIFAGCSSTKQDVVAGGDANAKVENNGGLAVKQGNYLYYINGLTALADIKEPEDNAFGNVVKGALMRAEMSDGKLVDAKVLVPFMTLSSSKTGGINVFGNWVYYTTPSTQKDKNGQMQTSYLEFLRTSIDGTTTQQIATLDGAQVSDYVYTPSALVYVSNGTINRISYDNNKVTNAGHPEEVAKEVTSSLLPKRSTYDPANVVEDVIFYTKSLEPKEGESMAPSYNNTYAVGAKTGSEAKVIVDEKSYLDTEEKKKNEKKFQYAISLKNYNIVEGGIELYYEKANPNNTENAAGLFGAIYKDGKLDVKNEKRFTNKPAGNVYFDDFTKGIYVYEGSKLMLMNGPKAKAEGENGPDIFAPVSEITLTSNATIIDFVDYKFKGEEKAIASVLYMVSGKFYVRALSDGFEGNAVALSDEKYNADASWLLPEIIDGNIYFFNNEFYKYVDALSIESGKLIVGNEDKAHPLANLNAADKKAEEDKAKAEEENK